ncbi:MAG: riboflavin synthase [Proteobacteria bacterium]|nr:riboflavin synthase [Pseudomonadota bacterium]
MFTGIVEATAHIIDPDPRRFRIGRPASFDDIRIGSSIAVSGVCLSVTALDVDSMEFEVIPETLGQSKLGRLKRGDMVNLERAMKADARLDGHIVQGHVEGTGAISDMRHEGGVLFIKLPKELIKNIVHKGSIAIDGVSLTVASIKGEEISVALIPLTLKETTLGLLKAGDAVNVETDVLLKYAKNIL